MLEVLEIIKEVKPEDPRAISLEEDMRTMRREVDWTSDFAWWEE